MMNEEYISIAEFAKKVGVSPQAIYKRLSTDLSTYVQLVDNRKMLKISALEKFGMNPVDNQVNKFLNQVDNQNSTIEMLKETISLLKTQSEDLRSQLSVKDQQIEELNDRLKENIVLIDQQQKLQLVAENRIKLLEAKSTEQDSEEMQRQEELDQKEDELKKEKERAAAAEEELQRMRSASFWKRLTGKW